jgi:hypothetical protein
VRIARRCRPANQARRLVVDDHRGQRLETGSPGIGDRLGVAALVELGVAHEHDHPRADEALRPKRESDADGDREAVSQRAARDLDAGHEHAVRVVAES